MTPFIDCYSMGGQEDDKPTFGKSLLHAKTSVFAKV